MNAVPAQTNTFNYAFHVTQEMGQLSDPVAEAFFTFSFEKAKGSATTKKSPPGGIGYKKNKIMK